MCYLRKTKASKKSFRIWSSRIQHTKVNTRESSRGGFQDQGNCQYVVCLGLSSQDFSDVSYEELDNHITELSKDFPFCGEGMLKFLLEERGIKVQRMRLRDSIHRVDEEGVRERKKGRLQRRVYNMKGPNHLWHIDTNH